MKDTSDFVRNYNDLSKDTGFQWVFMCDTCGKEHLSAFDQFNFGTISDIADTIGDYLGGVAEGITDVGQGIEEKAYDAEHAKALEKAVKKTKEEFMKCPSCNLWVCKADCWDSGRNRCVACLGEGPVQPVRTSEGASCRQCGHPSDPDDTFCSNCGSELSAGPSFCSQCGKNLDRDDKFCPGCGHPV